jgi:hypothetical protein
MKGKHNSPKTEFKKGIVPHNKGKSKIELAGGMEYIIGCIKKDMSRDDIIADLGYKRFSNVAHFLSKNNTDFDTLCIELGKKYNETGYYRVSILNRPQLRQGFSYVYHPPLGSKYDIEKSDLMELKRCVEEKGYVWKKLNADN